MAFRVVATSGFTLLELVLVLAVLAVALAAVAPTLSGFATGRGPEEAAARFVALTRWARSQAISDGCSYRIAIDPSAGRWWLQAEEDGEFADVSTPQGRGFVLPDSVQMETDATMSEGVRAILFDATGVSDMATVRFIGKRTTLEVTCDAPIDEYHILREEQVRP